MQFDPSKKCLPSHQNQIPGTVSRQMKMDLSRQMKVELAEIKAMLEMKAVTPVFPVNTTDKE